MMQQTAAPQPAGGAEAITPQEEQLLTQAMDIALEVIHGEGSSGDKIAAMVLNSEDVAKGIGEAVATVLLAVMQQISVPDELVMALGTEILQELGDLAVQAGAISEDEINEQFIDTAVSHAYSAYITMQEAMGTLDKGKLKQSVDEAKAKAQEMNLFPTNQALRGQPQGLMQRAAGGV